MASASIYIQTRPYKDGTVPVFLRLIVNRKIRMREICRARAENIDRKKAVVKKSEPGYIGLNLLITRRLQEAREYLIDCDLKKVTPDPDVFFGRSGPGQTVADLVAARASDMEANPETYATGRKYRSVANKIRAMGLDIAASSISLQWIAKLDQALTQSGNKPITRRKDMVVISATMDKYGLPNPFHNYQKPNSEGQKDALNRTEFDILAEIPLPIELDIYRMAYVFAVMARGMRRFDILTLQWTSIAGDRLIYVPDKTRAKGKVVDMMITDRMQAILERCRLPEVRAVDVNPNPSRYSPQRAPDAYVFPILKATPELLQIRPISYRDRVNKAGGVMNTALKKIAELAGIRKNITIHTARHTFAYLADKHGVSLGDIQRMLKHGRPDTTAGYLRSLRAKDELDQASEGLF